MSEVTLLLDHTAEAKNAINQVIAKLDTSLETLEQKVQKVAELMTDDQPDRAATLAERALRSAGRLNDLLLHLHTKLDEADHDARERMKLKLVAAGGCAALSAVLL